MFVVYDEGILVLETPQTPAVSQAVIATIRQQHPGIPIRWAVPTHYHFDHSGGLYGYIREGVAIVTTAGNEEFVRQVAAAPRTIGSNAGGADHVAVETFTLARGKNSVVSRRKLVAFLVDIQRGQSFHGVITARESACILVRRPAACKPRDILAPAFVGEVSGRRRRFSPGLAGLHAGPVHPRPRREEIRLAQG